MLCWGGKTTPIHPRQDKTFLFQASIGIGIGMEISHGPLAVHFECQHRVTVCCGDEVEVGVAAFVRLELQHVSCVSKRFALQCEHGIRRPRRHNLSQPYTKAKRIAKPNERKKDKQAKAKAGWNGTAEREHNTSPQTTKWTSGIGIGTEELAVGDAYIPPAANHRRHR